MSDAGVAIMVGGFALAGATVGAALTALGANWLQVKQRDHDSRMWEKTQGQDRLRRDIEELRRLRRENYAPVFSALDELERYFGYRIATTTAWETYGADATKLDALLAEIEADQPAPKGHLLIRIGMSANRLEDRLLGGRLFTLVRTMSAEPFDHVACSAELRIIRQAVIEHAAKLESEQ